MKELITVYLTIGHSSLSGTLYPACEWYIICSLSFPPPWKNWLLSHGAWWCDPRPFVFDDCLRFLWSHQRIFVWNWLLQLDRLPMRFSKVSNRSHCLWTWWLCLPIFRQARHFAAIPSTDSAKRAPNPVANFKTNNECVCYIEPSISFGVRSYRISITSYLELDTKRRKLYRKQFKPFSSNGSCRTETVFRSRLIMMKL